MVLLGVAVPNFNAKYNLLTFSTLIKYKKLKETELYLMLVQSFCNNITFPLECRFHFLI